jgi:hypothetical protein
MELQFEDNEYYLVDENNDTIATTDKILLKEYDGYMKKLSKQNCDEIFGVVDVVDVIYKQAKNGFDGIINPFTEAFAKACIDKAMELNKDKLFTVEDMGKLHNMIMCNIVIRPERSVYDPVPTEKYIQSLQQPKEIEVEIEMETKQQLVNGYRNQNENVIGFIAEYESVLLPKLDDNGCLILKKK